MRCLLRGTLFFCSLSITSPSFAVNYLNHSPNEFDEWAFSLSAYAYAWSLDGSISVAGLLTDNIADSFSATGDSLNYSTEATGQFSITGSNRKWSVGAHYLPASYDGTGSGISGVMTSNIGGFVTVDVQSEVDLEFTLLEATYHVIATDTASLGFGFGAGQIGIDLNFATATGAFFTYEADNPFGYLTIRMMNRHDRLFYGFTLNGIKFDDGETYEEDIDYILNFGYRLVEGKSPIDLHGGWRQMNLKFEIKTPTSGTRADIELRGPYLGLSATF